MNNITNDKTQLWNEIQSLYDHITFLNKAGDHNLAKMYNTKLVDMLWHYIELDEVL